MTAVSDEELDRYIDELHDAFYTALTWDQYDSYVSELGRNPWDDNFVVCREVGCHGFVRKIVRSDLVNKRTDPTVIDILECGHVVWPG
jgi:hypothetical protein